MQHHGVPTRLLDWTKSPYVATYFALEEEPSKGHSAVWALDLDWLKRKGHELLQSDPAALTPAGTEYLNGSLAQTERPVIIEIKPLHADERMFAQQGILLCKLVHPATFGQILMSMMIHPETPDRPVVRKLEVENNLRIEFLKRLRGMNIHRASLFPGLDGFGISLKLDLEMKVKGGEE